MSLIINDELVAARLIEERRTKGLDRFDEVWDGVYVMSPLANNEHQRITMELAVALHTGIKARGLGTVYQGANVSDRNENWNQNFRVPDVLVFLNDTTAEDRGTHWYGGPDFAVEVVSPGDRTLEKLDFYAAVKTKELLVIDRDPWQLSLYRRNARGKMEQVGESTLQSGEVINSDIIAATFSLLHAEQCIRVSDPAGSIISEIEISC
ncbi:MAG: Uma2 family endonuclease [Planctomycetota bacterium]